jgi:tetratricopeptide (TPR) repeat protein
VVLLLLALVGGGVYLVAQVLRAEYHLRAAQKARDAGDFAAAEAHVRDCLRLRPDSVPVHFLAAELAARARDFDRAWDHLTVCLKHQPDHAAAHFLAAQTARRADWYDRAERHLAECARLQESQPDAVPPGALAVERLLQAAQRGELSAAVEGPLQACVHEGDPYAPVILEALVRGYMNSFRLPKALEAATRLLELQPKNVQVLVWRGQTYARLGGADDARKDFRKALELDPDNDAALLGLAENLVAYAKAPEALKLLERLWRRQPDNEAMLLTLARCYRDLNRPEEAARVLDRLLASPKLRSSPRFAQALNERAQLALNLGRPAEAESWARKALAVAPYELEVNYTLHRCLQHLKKGEEAQACHARIKDILADRALLDQAIRKVQESPRDPALRREVGLIFQRRGQHREAVAWFVSALNEDPHHRATHLSLADSYQGLGEPARAAHHRRLAQADPKPAPKPAPKGPQSSRARRTLFSTVSRAGCFSRLAGPPAAPARRQARAA